MQDQYGNRSASFEPSKRCGCEWDYRSVVSQKFAWKLDDIVREVSFEFSLGFLIIFSLYNIMDVFTTLFWLSFLIFIGLSLYLLCCTKRTPVFYAQIAAGCGMFITSKIGRTFLGLA